jgi:hypothetical protein
MTRAFLPALWVAASVALAGCATDRPPSGPASLTLPTSATTTPRSTTSTSGSSGSTERVAPGSTAAGRPTATFPAYQPATVIALRSTTVLRSPDAVTKVAAFYIGALRRGGWRAATSNPGGRSAKLVARKGPQTATITIVPAGRGSSITVETSRS